MKRVLLIGIIVLACLSAFAQTQKGFVKAIGRPGKPGVMLTGVVNQAQGMVNPVISDTTGEFNLNNTIIYG